MTQWIPFVATVVAAVIAGGFLVWRQLHQWEADRRSELRSAYADWMASHLYKLQRHLDLMYAAAWEAPQQERQKGVSASEELLRDAAQKALEALGRVTILDPCRWRREEASLISLRLNWEPRGLEPGERLLAFREHVKEIQGEVFAFASKANRTISLEWRWRWEAYERDRESIDRELKTRVDHRPLRD